jgi:hypothetical protein
MPACGLVQDGLIRKSPTHTQPSRSSARCCASPPVGGAGSAHKAGKNLAIRAAYAVRSRDDTNRGGWPRIAFGTGGARGTGHANWSLWSRRPALARRSRGTLSASLALRALRSHGSGWTWWTGGTAFANLTLGADWSLRTLCALRTCWTNRTGRAGLARGTGRTFAPGSPLHPASARNARAAEILRRWRMEFPPVRRARLH